MKKAIRILSACVLCLALSPHVRPANAQSPGGKAPQVIEIWIAPNSQANSRPQMDAVWNAKVIAGHLNPSGIGVLVNPVFENAPDQYDFALHQNPLLGSPPFVSGLVPNPVSSTVMFRTSSATTISGVEIIQHQNGVNQVAIGAGPAVTALAPAGAVAGPLGLVANNCAPGLVYEGQSQIFTLPAPASGTYFAVTVTGAYCSTGFAIHRMFLLDQSGKRILAR